MQIFDIYLITIANCCLDFLKVQKVFVTAKSTLCHEITLS